MFGPDHYVPILKGKMGEIQSLSHLDKYTREKLTPFIDVPPTNPVNVEGKSLEKHLIKINKPMRLAWGLDLPFFIDLS